MSEKLSPSGRNRLARECAKLSPEEEEQAMAEEGVARDMADQDALGETVGENGWGESSDFQQPTACRLP